MCGCGWGGGGGGGGSGLWGVSGELRSWVCTSMILTRGVWVGSEAYGCGEGPSVSSKPLHVLLTSVGTKRESLSLSTWLDPTVLYAPHSQLQACVML